MECVSIGTSQSHHIRYAYHTYIFTCTKVTYTLIKLKFTWQHACNHTLSLLFFISGYIKQYVHILIRRLLMTIKIHFCHNCCMWNHDSKESKTWQVYTRIYIYIVCVYVLSWPFSIFLCCIYLKIHYFITCNHNTLFTTNIEFAVLVCCYHKLNYGSYDNHSI